MSEYGYCPGCAKPRIRKPGYVWNEGKPDRKELSASVRCQSPTTEACKKIEWLKGTKPSELATQPVARPPSLPRLAER